MDQLQYEGMWGPTLLSNLQTCCFMAVFCICLISPSHKARWHSLAGEFTLYFLHRKERDFIFLLCTALCHLIKGTKILALRVSVCWLFQEFHSTYFSLGTSTFSPFVFIFLHTVRHFSTPPSFSKCHSDFSLPISLPKWLTFFAEKPGGAASHIHNSLVFPGFLFWQPA